MDTLSDAVDTLRLFSDPTRLRLAILLDERELTVAEITKATQLPQSRVSTHLVRRGCCATAVRGPPPGSPQLPGGNGALRRTQAGGAGGGRLAELIKAHKGILGADAMGSTAPRPSDAAFCPTKAPGSGPPATPPRALRQSRAARPVLYPNSNALSDICLHQSRSCPWPGPPPRQYKND